MDSRLDKREKKSWTGLSWSVNSQLADNHDRRDNGRDKSRKKIKITMKIKIRNVIKSTIKIKSRISQTRLMNGG